MESKYEFSNRLMGALHDLWESGTQCQDCGCDVEGSGTPGCIRCFDEGRAQVTLADRIGYGQICDNCE